MRREEMYVGQKDLLKRKKENMAEEILWYGVAF